MRVVTNANTLQRVGVKHEAEFTINASAQAFKILSDGLYSDKPRAILRELSCNAYDAHVDAGNALTPFDVQIPNHIDPTFRIRDYGTGLSPDDMGSVYKTYFQSTKTDTNDQIGCLGLGSKSPFAYTDSFTTTTYYNGTKYIYNAHINESGTPAIALMGEIKTDEPNGLEISFTVESQDMRSFEYKIQPVFEYFKLMPNITGTNTQPTPVEYTMKKDGKWGLRSTGSEHAMAVMGNVAYPINNMDIDDMSKDERALLRRGALDIFFDIGDLEVQPSREGLAFNKRTIKNIRERLDGIIEEIREEARKTINDCKTLWEARVSATSLDKGEYSHLSFLFDGQGIFKWKGQELSTNGFIRIDDKSEGISVDDFDVIMFESRSSHRANCGYSVSKTHTSTMRADKNIRVYLNDIKKGQHIRCKQEAIQDGVERVYLITCAKPAVLKKIMKRTGLTKIPSISEVEVIKEDKSGMRSVNRAAYNPKNAKKVLAYNTDTKEHSYGSWGTYWSASDVDMTKGGVYVVIERYKITEGGNLRNYDSPASVIDHYTSMLSNVDEKFDFKLIGIKPSMMDKEDVRSNKNWVTLSEYVEDKIKKYVHDKSRLSNIVEYKKWIDFKQNRYNRIGNLDDVLQLISDNNITGGKELTEYITAMKDMDEKSENGYAHLLSAVGQLNIKLDEKDDTIKVRDFGKMVKGINDRYSAMRLMGGHYYNTEEKKDAIKGIQDYINLVDSVK